MQKRRTRPPPVRKPRLPTTAQFHVAMDMIEQVANGATLKSVLAVEGAPPVAAFRRWLLRDPELRAAYEEAKRLKADTLFDEALDLARRLKDAGATMGSPEVRAIDVALNHFRWTAGKLNPQVYSERASAAPIVPIQIITSLDLGQPGAQTMKIADDIYTIDVKARVPEPEDDQKQPSNRPSGGRVEPAEAPAPQPSGETNDASPQP